MGRLYLEMIGLRRMLIPYDIFDLIFHILAI